MFAESLLENSRAENERRSWTTLTSFGLQGVIIGLLLLVPLLTTVGLPSARIVSTSISVGRREPGSAPHLQGGPRDGARIGPQRGPIMQPREIPTGVPPGKDTAQSAVPMGDPSLPIGYYIGAGPGFLIPEMGN